MTYVFTAKNIRELGIIIKGLYLSDVKFSLNVNEDDNNKLTYDLIADIPDMDVANDLERVFKIYIQHWFKSIKRLCYLAWSFMFFYVILLCKVVIIWNVW